MSVYFIADDYDRVKIGHADDPQERLGALQCGSPERLYIMRIVEGGQKAERWFHRRFASLRLHGEWFKFSPEMLSLAAPDEVPAVRSASIPHPPRSIGEYLREADALGILPERMRAAYAPLLGDGI